MKKLFIIILITVLAAAVAISFGCGKPKLSGTYEGTLPAADCPGLQTLITFNSDGSFYMEETFLERDEAPTITEGKWKLDGDIITLSFDSVTHEYRLVSDKEIKWAPGGEEITGTDLNWSLFKK